MNYNKTGLLRIYPAGFSKRSSGKLYCLLVTIILFSILLSCEREDMFTFAEHRLNIGDIGPGGGIVFHVTDGGLHGMEAAPADQGASQAWITPTLPQSTLNGNTSALFGTGESNSYAIISQAGHTSSAAQVCLNFEINGYEDWFLPSLDELQAIWWNLVSDHSAANSGRGAPYSGSLGGFSAGDYLSSTEFNASYAWGQSFSTGYQSSSWAKNSTTLCIRPVRNF